MKKARFTEFSLLTFVGALMLASCSSQPPAQTMTINVEVPAAKTEGDKTASSQPTVEIDETEAGQAAKARSSEPTDRDVEDPAPASKAAPKPASSGNNKVKGKSQLMDFYDRLPAKHFAAFGGVNRRSLLNRKGAIIDYKRNFIEIPGSFRPDDGDLERLQITLFPNGNEPWCAVSRIVWSQGQTPGALDFYYGEADSFDRQPRTTAADFFPYKLQKTPNGYQSAFLPRKGLDIVIGIIDDAEAPIRRFHYDRNFSVGESAFKQVYD